MWKKIGSKVIYRTPWLTVVEDEVKTESGKRLQYSVVRKDPFVLIIPWNGKELSLVQQYRYPIERESLEFPQGHADGDALDAAARRELAEETGIVAETLEELGDFDLAPGLTSQRGKIFFATYHTVGAPQPEETEEGLQHITMTPNAFKHAVATGKLTDAPTLAAWTILQQRYPHLGDS